jgi:zinc protease
VSLPDRTVLDNGAILISQALPSNPSIAFRGSLPAGMAQEAEDYGVAEFTSRLLLGGTRQTSASKLADRLESMGATLEFFSSEESLGFSGRCTRATLAEVMRILVECLNRPAFPAREVERVRGELLNDARIELDDTRQRAFRDLARIVYPDDHPYGRDPKGGEARIRRLRRSAIVAFHDARVGAEGLILAIAGDVDRSSLERSVEPAIAKVRTADPPNPIPPVRPYRRRDASIPMPHKSQADIAVGGPGVPRRHPDYYALYLANLLFGRIGLFGRLGRNLRDEQGLAYYAYSGLEARSVGGMWIISAGVNPANLERAVRGIRAELDRLRAEPFTAEEIEDGKDNQVGSLVVSMERNAEVAAELHRIEYYNLGLDFLERYPDIVRGLTPESVRSIGSKYFAAANASMVLSGPIGRGKFSL